jgi:hypothetical protein
MWIVLSFLALGFLIGNIVGMTAQSVVTSLLGLLFAFAGGSVLTFIHKLDAGERRLAGQAVLALSLACVGGLYTGIFVSEHRLLSPKPASTAVQAMPSPATGLAAQPQPAPGDQKNTAKADRENVSRTSIPSAANKYLLRIDMKEVDAIDHMRGAGDLSADEAYNLLYKLVKHRPQSGGE